MSITTRPYFCSEYVLVALIYLAINFSEYVLFFLHFILCEIKKIPDELVCVF
jgi:hypothetical protein